MLSFGKPSKKKFALALREAIRQIDGDYRYEYDEQEFRLVRQDDDGEANLQNMYLEHCALPRSERKAHLERLAKVFAVGVGDDLPANFVSAGPHLRPKIWPRSTFANLELERAVTGKNDLDIPLYPLGGHLYSSLVFDTEHAMQTVSHENLETWGVSYYEALEVACQNLDETTTTIGRIGDRLHASLSGDNYDSSRVLLLDRIQSFDVIGRHVAVVPQRDAMYVAGSDDAESLEILFSMAEKMMAEEARPLSPLPMILDDGEWIDWEPPADHPIRPRYDKAALYFFGTMYTEQQALHAKLHENDDHAPYAATFSAVEVEKTGKLTSYSVWGKGVDTLLPKTDVLFLAAEEGTAASAEWDHATNIVGDLMEAEESYYPIRYRVREFPTAEQLAAIGDLGW